eukprot:TRINITY_DN1709_c1_g1_i1.p4 TRINITY_DN1709_c1_g1~~TRINITY_DN1709_c1_g1_i1.p4  ORF type:complete len:103 (+),score=12.04 TRINITY_DN1709_c1_g1_i1:978-1286(+)
MPMSIARTNASDPNLSSAQQSVAAALRAMTRCQASPPPNAAAHTCTTAASSDSPLLNDVRGHTFHKPDRVQERQPLEQDALVLGGVSDEVALEPGAADWSAA